MSETDDRTTESPSTAGTSAETESLGGPDFAAGCKFVMTTCQQGAEGALKAEMARQWPEFRFAFSRPGFVTFKLPEGHGLGEDANLYSVFARASSLSIGRAAGESPEERARDVWRLAAGMPIDAVHVWQRDLAVAGYRGYEPGPTTSAEEVRDEILQQRPAEFAEPEAGAGKQADVGQLVLDCVLVEPDSWWVGFHRASTAASQWPGGLRAIELPVHAVSRAYLKMVEAMRWLRTPLRPGQVVTELGCSPGGAVQAMLDRGLKVIGVDPAEVDPVVMASPDFTHVRRHATEVPLKLLRDTRLLVNDMNVAPKSALEMVEKIVTHPSVKIHGLLLTMKLLDWEMAGDIPRFCRRVRSWGYRDVRARQLQYNRQEVCLAALRRG